MADSGKKVSFLYNKRDFYPVTMKKLLCVIFMISCLWYSAYASDVEDDSIIDALDQENTQVLDIDYSMKSFDSCDAFEDVMETYIKSYWENNYTSWYIRRGIPEVMNMEIMEDSVVEESAKSAVSDSAVWGADDFSQTNTQVLWVDESDIVKTDGTYHYYYNETQKAVYVVSSDSELEIIKKINLPKTFYGPELYVSEGRLVIIASGYSNTDYSKRGYYINRNSKTYTIVYDTSDIQAPELIKFYSSDGDVSRTRRIGDHVYVISRNYINFPYWSYKDASDIELDASLMLPQKIDISKTSEKSAQNLSLKGTDFPYNVVSWDVSGCEKISYSFPDEETLKNTNFNPGYNIISVINIESPEQKVETHVVAGSNSEIYMSTENLYMTEAIWQPNNFSCPQDALCAMPFFWGGSQNTLVHKLSVDEREVEYQNTALVPWSPLSQYSMDEYEWNFRIITSQWSPERSTGLYILDKDLKSLSSLTELAPGETFQSSRFIGDKLFLVTFEQIDPLFAIDVWDPKKPEILWELKIPWFSTYLHPYDDEHLIGLWYDTQLNQWGGTQTAGVKLDLYKINYDKKCWEKHWTIHECLYGIKIEIHSSFQHLCMKKMISGRLWIIIMGYSPYRLIKMQEYRSSVKPLILI